MMNTQDCDGEKKNRRLLEIVLSHFRLLFRITDGFREDFFEKSFQELLDDIDIEDSCFVLLS